MDFSSDAGGPEARFRFPAELEGRYRPLRLLGAGGMGAVYAAFDQELERHVAVKVTAPFGSPRHKERFRREASTLARLDHPSVIRLHQFGQTALCPYIVMELLEGHTLDEHVGHLTSMEPLLRVAEGLQAVHDLGLTHRDVKPSNVMITHEGRVVLLDFGIVHDPGRDRLTAMGPPVGTPGFLPPESFRDVEPAPSADWFAFGVTCFLLCEGRLPFTPEEIVAAVGLRELPLIRFARVRPNRPPATLIRRCLRFRPEQRPADLEAIRAAFTARSSTSGLHAVVRKSVAIPDQPAHSYSRGPRARDTLPGLDPPPPPRLVTRMLRMLVVGVLAGVLAAAWILAMR